VAARRNVRAARSNSAPHRNGLRRFVTPVSMARHSAAPRVARRPHQGAGLNVHPDGFERMPPPQLMSRH
jgi:hypothetical protein